MNIMFDQSFPVAKQDLPVPLKYEDLIFVFEDVDASSRIVKKRHNKMSNVTPRVKTKAIANAAARQQARNRNRGMSRQVKLVFPRLAA